MRLEEKLGLDPGSLKSQKEDISQKIDQVLEELNDGAEEEEEEEEAEPPAKKAKGGSKAARRGHSERPWTAACGSRYHVHLFYHL